MKNNNKQTWKLSDKEVYILVDALHRLQHSLHTHETSDIVSLRERMEFALDMKNTHAVESVRETDNDWNTNTV